MAAGGMSAIREADAEVKGQFETDAVSGRQSLARRVRRVRERSCCASPRSLSRQCHNSGRRGPGPLQDPGSRAFARWGWGRACGAGNRTRLPAVVEASPRIAPQAVFPLDSSRPSPLRRVLRRLPPERPPQVKVAVAAKLGACESIEVQRYRTQVVAGTNFKVHAKVDGKDVIITAFRPLPHTGEALSVSAVVEGSDL